MANGIGFCQTNPVYNIKNPPFSGLQAAVGKGATDAAYQELSMGSAFGKAVGDGLSYMASTSIDGQQAQIDEGLEKAK